MKYFEEETKVFVISGQIIAAKEGNIALPALLAKATL